MITKTTKVIISNLQNSHLLTLSLPTEEVFQVNGQNRPVANLPVVDFHSQPREMLTRYGYGCFSVLAAIIQESSDKQLVLRIVKNGAGV